MATDFAELSRLEMDKVAPIIDRYPWEDPRGYAMWLAQTHHLVKYSTRLVALAAAYVPLGNDGLHALFANHTHEERGHQLVCKADLDALGFSLGDFPCLSATAALHQIQYYWVERRGAVSFFGYMLALEMLARQFAPSVYARVVPAHGARTGKFLKLHGEVDIGHTDDAFVQLATLTDDDAALVTENLRLSSELYRTMLEQAHAQVAAKRLAATA